jgi:hypothetical protein
MTDLSIYEKFPVTRFSSCQRRDTAEPKTLADYLREVTGNRTLPGDKTRAPAWALCNDTGTNDGTPNGLIQLDFDHVTDVPGLRRALAEYGGFIAVVRTFSGAGIVALGYVGKRIASDTGAVKRLVYVPLKSYLRVLGFDDGLHYTLDPACAKPCQLRFESRDSEAWISGALCRLCADPEDSAALDTHPVAWLAEALRPGDGASPAGIAGALACVSMAADLRSRMAAGASAYAARAFCVVIGAPGSRKTTLLEAVQDTARALGVTVSDPKNAPTLREHIMACGCDEVIEAAPIGKKQAVKLVERADRPADPLIVCIDEAGQRLRTRVQDESCGSMAAMLRQCNGDRITLEGTVKQEKKGSYRVPAHVSALLATTPAQWAEYVGAAGQQNGETRRMIELWQDSEARDMFAGAPPAPDIDTALEMLRKLREMGELWSDSDAVFEPSQDARGAFRSAVAWLVGQGLDEPSAHSLVMCYSTLCAGLRASMDGRTVITAADLGAAMCILRRVLNARSRLAAECERAEAASYKPDGAVWGEILAWIEKTPRRDKVLEKIARRPPQYRKVYDEMVAQRAITSGKDESTGKYILRIATAEELEQGEEQAETRRAAVNTETRQIQASRRAYAECSDEDKEARVLAYVERWRMDNALTEGNRNIALNKLAWSMQGAGLWDAVARQIYDIIAANSGLGEAEIRSLMRARKKRGTP